jgi:hypothetical protein
LKRLEFGTNDSGAENRACAPELWISKKALSSRSFSPWSEVLFVVPPRKIMDKTPRQCVALPIQTIDFQ